VVIAEAIATKVAEADAAIATNPFPDNGYKKEGMQKHTLFFYSSFFRLEHLHLINETN
jgi:hypothetical protein